MSMTDGAAPAAAESTPAPEPKAEEVVQTPNPVETQPEPAKPEQKPARRETARDALDRAEKKVEAESKAKPEPKPVEKKEPAKAEEPVKEERPRGEHGHFAKKEGEEPVKPAEQAKPEPKPTAFKDAPGRFSSDAKAAWEQTPEAVRAESHRMLREFEQGYEKHRQSAQQWDELRDFHELATKNGTTVKQVLGNYVGLINMLKTQPVAALERIVTNIGLKRADGSSVTLRDIAGHVLNQKPDEVASRQDGVIASLKQQISQLEQKLGGVTQNIERQQTEAQRREVEAFAAQHSRFDELASDIEFFVTSGRAKSLSEAYELAERLNPAPAKASPSEPLTPAKTADPVEPQKLNKGSLSVTGAPSSGSSPAKGKPSPSARSAIDRAFARAS
jgi:hypothetical protein